MSTATPRTVLITGSSTGIGRAAAFHFQKMGWNVIATMRTPSKERELNQLERVHCIALDVTSPESIETGIQAGIQKFGAIDVLVNNAGYGLMGVFEAMTAAQIEKQFATNVFGLMSVCRSIIPYFRKKGGGTIINIASVGGRITFPLFSPYHSTKWAVEGFSESLSYELAPLSIYVKLVEPGPIKTDFYGRSADVAEPTHLPAYQKYMKVAGDNMVSASNRDGLPPEAVAKVIFQAALDQNRKLRYPVGFQIKAMLLLRRLLPVRLFMGIIESVVLKGLK